ncbi:DUF4328 domain-containing protein [Actinomadura fibrosa]|uniref:DUF4328 domain-containing protein n=1 Tax=Actinomadura fibrosa TaxID=111802 RepID=A0ABW2Y2U9_9ACTN|nr:DUF4328 domain-containing protein [Actinomadura fibrosa]
MTSPAVPPAVPVAHGPVKPVRAFAITVMAALGFSALLLLVEEMVDLWALSLAGGTSQRFHTLMNLHDAMLLFIAVGFLGSAVSMMAWMWRSRSNAQTINDTPHQWGRPWIIIGWLVPLLNLVVPRRIVGDIWTAVAPGRRPVLVNVWWVLWLVYFVSDTVVDRFGDGTTRDSLRAQLQGYAVTTPIGIAAAALAIVMIWRISRLQEEHATRIAQAIAAPAPA